MNLQDQDWHHVTTVYSLRKPNVERVVSSVVPPSQSGSAPAFLVFRYFLCILWLANPTFDMSRGVVVTTVMDHTNFFVRSIDGVPGHWLSIGRRPFYVGSGYNRTDAVHS